MGSGGEAVVRALKRRGVDTLFTLPGTGIMPIYDAALTHGLRVIDGRHEAAVVHMAEGYARAARAPGVAVLPEGPGLANGVGGMASAYVEGSPVLVLSAVPPLAEHGKGARQELPQTALCAPITRQAGMVRDAGRLADAISDALDLTLSGVPGPVYVGVPTDILDSGCADRRAGAREPRDSEDRPPAVSGSRVSAAVDLLAGAGRPAIIAGSLVYWRRAEALLEDFVEHTGLPLFTVERARGLIPDSHPLCFGDAYASVNPVAGNLQHADVILLLGDKVDCRYAYGHAFGSAKLIQAWPLEADIGRNRAAAVGLAGDVKPVLGALREAAAQRTRRGDTPWLETLRAARREHGQAVAKLAGDREVPLHPAQVALALAARLRDTDRLVFDGGDASGWARYCLPARRPGDWQLNTVFGQMGCGLPFALGARAAEARSRPVLVTGDGALGFGVMEFETAVRHGLPVVAVVCNDAAWGIEKHFQEKLYGPERGVATALRDVQWEQAAQAMGAHGEAVTEAGALGPALDRALACGRPACVNVRTRSAPSPLARTFTRMFVRERARRGGGT
ncbi:MAG: thiamine pyrophosphate-binding protein [Lentisphaerae bacterium]|nr:thiamine pyrophosphate-binding protein [Lentisphaerota bacterium]